MKLQEIRDLFFRRLKWKIGDAAIKELDIRDTDIASLISSAQEYLQDELKIIEANKTIELISGTSEYNLPENFGTVKIVNLDDTVKVYYYPNLGFYSPLKSGDQDWGYFDKVEFSGNLAIGRKYSEAIILYMLGNFIPDSKAEFHGELRKLRGSRVVSIDQSLNYGFYCDVEETGYYELKEIGIDELRQKVTSSGKPTHYALKIESDSKKIVFYPTPNTNSTGASSMSESLFKITFSVTEGAATGTVHTALNTENNLIDDFSVSVSGNEITVTSDNAEFTADMIAEVNNGGISHERISASTWKFYGYTGFGSFTAEIRDMK